MKATTAGDDFWVSRGATGVADVAPTLSALCDRVGAPVTVRPTWVQAWAESYPQYQPLVVGVDDAAGTAAAAVALAVRQRRIVDDVVLCGHGPTDVVAIPAVSEEQAARLARAVRHVLGQRNTPWRMQLRHVAAGDHVAAHLLEALPRAAWSPDDVSPALQASAGTDLRDYVSASHRRGISRIRNRMVNAALGPEVEHLTAPEDVEAAMPQIEAIHRSRDESLGRRSALDDPRYAGFFRRVVTRHAREGRLCLTTLRLEGRLAAYTLCFLDGKVFRMWNCRFDPAWGRFSPGKLAMDESVAHALAEGCVTYDFMRGAEPYKYSYANDEQASWDLRAASSALVGLPLSLTSAARVRARSLREGEGYAARAVHAADAVRARWST